jgi:hypothetical protein
MKREVIEMFLGYPIPNADWRAACSRLSSIGRHAHVGAVLDRCIERGLSVEETFDELCDLVAPQAESPATPRLR